MRKLATLAVVLASVLAWRALATFEMTAALQKELDRHIVQIKAWAADPLLVKTVIWKNQMGPLSGMDNEKWKTVRRSDDLLRTYMTNDAGKVLARRLESSNGIYVRAFVCGTRGDQIAMTEKTENYFYAGQPRFDLPFRTGMPWQGPPELDSDTDTYDIQISAPVLSFGKPIGVLVVGVNLTRLEKAIGK
ncbi:MAG TPA: hypothetical protein VMV60_06985 [Thermoanaerobaculia bacterium]|nr:hypothetical protein [Thermoanaerobaculia bacterium]